MSNQDNSGYEDIMSDNTGYEDIMSSPEKEHPENLLQKIAKATSQTMEAYNTGTVPQSMANDDPTMSAARNESMGINSQYLNSMAAGIPGLAAGIFNKKIPSSSNKDVNLLANAAGSIAGAPGNILVDSAKKAGSAIVKRNPFSKENRLQLYTEMRKKSNEFHEGVTGGFYKTMKDAQAAAPSKTVNLKPMIDEINHTSAFQPELQELIENSPQLKNLVDNPTLSEGMPLEESQALINEVGQVLPRLTRISRSVKPGEIPAFKFHEGLKRMQETYFPEMANARNIYGPDIEASSTIRSQTSKPNAMERSIRKDFGGDEGHAAAERVFGKKLTDRATGERWIGEFTKKAKTGVKLAAGAKALKFFGF